MRRKVFWHHDAVEDLFELAVRNQKLARRVMIAIRAFGMGSRADIKKLADRDDQWRLRVGDWRIVMTLDGDKTEIDAIDNRRDAH